MRRLIYVGGLAFSVFACCDQIQEPKVKNGVGSPRTRTLENRLNQFVEQAEEYRVECLRIFEHSSQRDLHLAFRSVRFFLEHNAGSVSDAHCEPFVRKSYGCPVSAFYLYLTQRQSELTKTAFDEPSAEELRAMGLFETKAKQRVLYYLSGPILAVDFLELLKVLKFLKINVAQALQKNLKNELLAAQKMPYREQLLKTDQLRRMLLREVQDQLDQAKQKSHPH